MIDYWQVSGSLGSSRSPINERNYLMMKNDNDAEIEAIVGTLEIGELPLVSSSDSTPVRLQNRLPSPQLTQATWIHPLVKRAPGEADRFMLFKSRGPAKEFPLHHGYKDPSTPLTAEAIASPSVVHVYEERPRNHHGQRPSSK